MVIPFEEINQETEYVQSFLKICENNPKNDECDYPRKNKGRPIYEWFSENRKNPATLETLPEITDSDVSLKRINKILR